MRDERKKTLNKDLSMCQCLVRNLTNYCTELEICRLFHFRWRHAVRINVQYARICTIYVTSSIMKQTDQDAIQRKEKLAEYATRRDRNGTVIM